MNIRDNIIYVIISLVECEVSSGEQLNKYFTINASMNRKGDFKISVAHVILKKIIYN